MQTRQLIEWLKNPETLGREAGAQLEAMTRAFPYFQSVQLLYIKTLHNESSFLYNNQLKAAAAYAGNRRILYELITKKSVPAATTISQPVQTESGVQNPTHIEPATNLQPANTDQPVVQPEFPQKRFVNRDDEWEAGMVRQLQLLHHWRNQPESELRPILSPHPEKQPEQKEETATTLPTASEEINTLLYVLVESNEWEDGEEPANTVESETAPTTTPISWDVKAIDESIQDEQPVNPVLNVPQDPVQQDILLGAIHASIQQEVDDRWLTPAELQPRQPTTAPEEKSDPVSPVQHVAEETTFLTDRVAESEATSSFSKWLRMHSPAKNTEINVPVAEDSEKMQQESTTDVESDEDETFVQDAENAPGDTRRLLDRFIREEPRILPNKNKFFNPVNMARQSVQENDFFLTETLARIYTKQGNFTKAIRTYQKLSLKFPEKSSYFAALIEELKRTPKQSSTK